MVYTMLYHIECLFIIFTLLHLSRPATFLPSPFQRLSCSQTLFSQSLLTPLLSFSDSDLAWLTPAIPPHPDVELIQPTSVASAFAGIRHSSLAIPELMRQGGCYVATYIAWHQRYTPQNVLSPAQIQTGQVGAAGRVKEHWHSILLHD